MALTSEQRRNANIIISVGRSLGATQRDILIAIMVSLQESGLRNLRYGDRDSVGLFQQRNAWGSFKRRTTPSASARMFFLGGMGGQPGLFDIRNRGSMALTYAAQAVQRSAFPRAYAKHESLARQALGARGGTMSTSGAFIRPIRGGTISSGFGPRSGSAGISKNHHGIDIRAVVGSPVYAAASGRVVRVTTGGNYGTRIEIAHEGRLWTLYAHLSRTRVRVGQQVMAGQLIGSSGGRRGAPGAGNSTGPHLHFEVRTGANSYGSAVNPQSYLNGRSTPDSYVEETVVVPAQLVNPVEQALTPSFAEVAPEPYVYINPLDQLGATEVPVLAEDPLARFGTGTPINVEAEPPSLGETELDRHSELVGALMP